MTCDTRSEVIKGREDIAESHLFDVFRACFNNDEALTDIATCHLRAVYNGQLLQLIASLLESIERGVTHEQCLQNFIARSQGRTDFLPSGRLPVTIEQAQDVGDGNLRKVVVEEQRKILREFIQKLQVSEKVKSKLFSDELMKF